MTPMGPKLSLLEVLVNIRQFIESVRCYPNKTGNGMHAIVS